MIFGLKFIDWKEEYLLKLIDRVKNLPHTLRFRGLRIWPCWYIGVLHAEVHGNAFSDRWKVTTEISFEISEK